MHTYIEINFVTVLDFIGTFAFAISGIRLASEKNFDLFGAFIVGMATACGGGTIRDVFLGNSPFWMTQWVYLAITAFALLVYICSHSFINRIAKTMFTFDTIGLALFTVVGFEKTINAGFPFWAANIMGMMTGAAGGVIRDILINEVPLIFRRDIYALACAVGGIIYTIGGVIYALKVPLFDSRHKNFGSHEIFHIFVMLGSACHFIVMYFFVAPLPV